MKISELEVDQKVVEEGTWVSNIPELEGVSFKVRGSNNRAWRKLAQTLVNAVPRKKRVNGVLEPEEADKITATVILNAGLLDWEGIEADDDTPIPYSREKAAEFLKGRRFREAAAWACDQVAEGLAKEAEEIAGN